MAPPGTTGLIYLNENLSKTDQNTGQKSGFVDSGFVKTFNELVTGLVNENLKINDTI